MLLNHVYHKSCEKMEELADESVNMVVTSPPYFNLKQYACWQTYIDHILFIEKVLRECYRVLVPGGWICWNIQECVPIPKDQQLNDEREGCYPLLADTIRSMQSIGYYYEKDIIWYKGKGTATQKLFGSYPYPSLILISGLTEHIITARKPKGKFKREISDGVKEKSKLTKEEWGAWGVDLWEIPPAKGSVIGHEAPYPVELAYRCIRLNSFWGDVVLDPFMGSGSTALAAMKCGRKYIGYEMHEHYVKLIQSRIRNDYDMFGEDM